MNETLIAYRLYMDLGHLCSQVRMGPLLAELWELGERFDVLHGIVNRIALELKPLAIMFKKVE